MWERRSGCRCRRIASTCFVQTSDGRASLRGEAKMELIWQGAKQAVLLLVHGDPEVLRIMLLSLQVSGTATLLSLLIGIPLGTVLALSRFPGRSIAISLDRKSTRLNSSHHS